MITDKGKAVISKYMIGQTPAYASYLAIGCGPKPLTTIKFEITKKSRLFTTATITVPNHNIKVGDSISVSGLGYKLDGTFIVTDKTGTTISYETPSYSYTIAEEDVPSETAYVFKNYSSKVSLDFETLRVPIVSRGYVSQEVGGEVISQLVLTAQLPAESRYGITEVGIYPAAINPVANNNDSKMLLNFDNNESWVVRNTTDTNNPTETVVSNGSFASVGISVDAAVVNSLDSDMTTQSRILNNEIPRNGAYSIVADGDLSTLSAGAPTNGKYLLITNPGINLSNSSPSDMLKIAFSAMPKSSSPSTLTGNATIVVEFGDNKSVGSGGYARATFVVDISDASSGTSRYFSDSIDIKDIVSVGGFSWTTATYVKVFAYHSNNINIVLDGLRLDNVSSESPVYGLVGYTVIKNSITTSGGTTVAVPAIKEKDKANLIEFRFRVDVGS